MDQSAAWLEPCGVRVQGTMVNFYTSSLLLIILSSYPSSLFSSWNSRLSSPHTCWHFMCVCVSMFECVKERRWLDALCHGVRWHQPVVDGKIKCNMIDMCGLKLSSFSAALCTKCVHISVAFTCGNCLIFKQGVIQKCIKRCCCIALFLQNNWPFYL